MNKAEVQKLADLARIKIDDQEAEILSTEVSAVLDYVKEIESANVSEGFFEPKNRNVFREDVVTNTEGKYTADILKDAPEEKAGYFKVKKIL